MKFKIYFLILSLFLLHGCNTRTQVDDIKLNKNQALYHFFFPKADEKLRSEWIRPHLVSLTGKHLRTKSFRGVTGESFEVIRVVEFENFKDEETLKTENRKVFDSLRNKTHFSVEIRIGK